MPNESIEMLPCNGPYKGVLSTVRFVVSGSKSPALRIVPITGTSSCVAAESFENYLGAKAHVVIIHSDAAHYMHVHPEVEGGKLDLHATFEETGMYRGWLQFQTEGKVHTADFVINVTEGKPGADGHEDHNHGAEHKDGDEHAKH